MTSQKLSSKTAYSPEGVKNASRASLKLDKVDLTEEINDCELLSRRKLVGLEILPSTYECKTPTNVTPTKLKDIKNF